jgi:hypothetical protein
MVHSRLVMVARARPRVSRSRAKHSMSGRLAWNRRRWRWWHYADLGIMPTWWWEPLVVAVDGLGRSA